MTIPFDKFSVGLPSREGNYEPPYNLVAGLHVHKKSVVVVVLQKAQPEQDYATGTFGKTQFGLKELAAFLRQHGVTHVAMESITDRFHPVSNLSESVERDIQELQIDARTKKHK